MLETGPPAIPCTHQLDDLLGEPDFLRIIELISKETMRSWSIPCSVARGLVLSAIGEPETLARIHDAWFLAKQNGESPGLAKVIVRRRVIDLLRKDARQTNHCSLPSVEEPIETDQPRGSFDDLVQRDPHVQLELRQVIQMVRDAVACFATQGRAQQRQARLLQRYALDEAKYSELSTELACSENALRVRVHKAMFALRKHIRECHSDLENLLT